MSHLILVRHGQSEWNLENRFTGWIDVDLTDQGVKEAHIAAKLLKDEGYIRDFRDLEVRKGINSIQIDLKYFNGNPVIKNIKRVSKPGIRVYSKISDLPKTYGGLGISILSTSMGVMSDNKARQKNVGGEVLCEVF